MSRQFPETQETQQETDEEVQSTQSKSGRQASILADTLATGFHNWQTKLQMLLWKSVRRWPQGAMVWGTSFSGSDILQKVFEHIGDLIKDQFGLDAQPMVRWACESDPKKREFLKQQHKNLEAIYASQVELSGLTAMNCLTGMSEVVPDVDGFCAGFTCTSRSPANPAAHKNKGCVQAGHGKAGMAFADLKDFVIKKRPRVILLENVPALSQEGKDGSLSDSEFILAWLKEQRYYAESLIVRAEEHGSVVNRTRLFFLAFEVQAGSVHAEKIAHDTFEVVRSALKQSKQARQPIDSFFKGLPADVESVSYVNKKQKQRQDPLFEDEHMELYTAAGMAWPPSLSTAPVYLHELLEKLTTRQREVVIYLDQVFPCSGGPGEREFADIHASLSRLAPAGAENSPWTRGYLLTLMTTTQYLMRSKHLEGPPIYELVHGLTLMAMTGWSLDMYDPKIALPKATKMQHISPAMLSMHMQWVLCHSPC